ncbi:MAG TPA: sugar phosphate isomerase/epimerase [Opitutaceae bacterium]|jgi:sugar phosphate isomerase/epimerase|nr:sugar phosphate isomerase/epimerase [Opitutaceae bacterium]
MDERTLTRRDAIRTAAFAGVLLPLLGPSRALAVGEAPAAAALPAGRLTLGLATYSLRKMDVDSAVKALAELQIDSVSVFRVHVPIQLSSPETCAEMANKFYAAGLAIRSTGVVTLKKSEADMRKAFECGKAAKLSMMTASYATPPDRETLLLTERFVKEYDMRLAFHNHGPEDSIFPSPYDVWKAVEPYDVRMGLCIDVGHSARAGVDPAEAIAKCASRVFDVHIKDTTAPAGAKKDQPVVVGKGRLDIRGIMAALLKINFKGQVGLEYEVDSPDPVPGIAQSFGYMRGVLDSLAPRFPVA